MRLRSLAVSALLLCTVIPVLGCGKNPGAAPQAQAVPSQISAEEAWTKIRGGALLVDVRSPEEFAGGHVDGALNVPHTAVAQNLAQFGSDKNREIVLYCHSGRRAGLARDALVASGYTKVFNAGGYSGLAAVK